MVEMYSYEALSCGAEHSFPSLCLTIFGSKDQSSRTCWPVFCRIHVTHIFFFLFFYKWMILQCCNVCFCWNRIGLGRTDCSEKTVVIHTDWTVLVWERVCIPFVVTLMLQAPYVCNIKQHKVFEIFFNPNSKYCHFGFCGCSFTGFELGRLFWGIYNITNSSNQSWKIQSVLRLSLPTPMLLHCPNKDHALTLHAEPSTSVWHLVCFIQRLLFLKSAG